MINLRYHIVSLTAVFLAIGIGLTLGSTFLDRATVDNLNGQLESLEGRLGDREARIQELQASLDAAQAADEALDAEGNVLLADRLVDVPVLIITEAGVDDEDLSAATAALAASGADLQGTLVITDRFTLDGDASVADLADVLDEESTDPSRLRRRAIDLLAAELRARQLLGLDEPTADPGPVPDDPPAEPTDGPGPADDAAGDPASEPADTTTSPATGDDETSGDDPERPSDDESARGLELVDALVTAGFLTFESTTGGPPEVTAPAGVRLVFVGGSREVPDDLVLEPLVERMVRGSNGTPLLGVVTSALPGDGLVGDAVAVIRQDDSLRELVPTVDSIEHFVGQAALVLALVDVADGSVGHYGLAEDATQLLPSMPGP